MKENRANINAGGLSITGFARSGISSWFHIKELGVLFDAGECPLSASKADSVLLSHYHADHAQCLNRHWELREMTNQSPASYYLPASCVGTVREVIHIQSETREDGGHSPNLIPVQDGDVFKLEHRRDVEVTAFKVGHRIDSLGYHLSQKTSRLRDGIDPKEVPDLIRQGVNVKEEHQRRIVTLIGDHNSNILQDEQIWESKVLLLESTYIGPKGHEKAKRWMHTHLDDIVEALRVHEAPTCKTLVLKHFSAQYDERDIVNMVKSAVPAHWADRVKVFL